MELPRNGSILLSVCLVVLCSVVFASVWTELIEYPSNPVYDPPSGARAYYPTVSYDANQFNEGAIGPYYKMWYSEGSAVSYAYSDDGINWTESGLVSNLTGGNQHHPVVVYDSGQFGGGTYYYKIWYWDYSAGYSTIANLRTADSVDGITWANDQVLQQHAADVTHQLVDGVGGSEFYQCYGPGSVIYNSAATNVGLGTVNDKSDDVPMTYRYVMYYDSSTGGAQSTSLAYSADGIYWTRYGSVPVIMYTGNTAEWDGTYRFRASVVIIDSQYHAWYSGANGSSWGCVPGYAHGIGHAVSNDGLNWSIDSDNPVFHVNDGVSWRECRTYTPSVIYDANMFSGHGDAYSYKMWFTGRTNTPATNYTVGYAGYLPVTTNPPVACFEYGPSTGFAPLSVNFDASCSRDRDGTIVKYLWEISDGTTATGMTFSKTFKESGVYTIQLTVIDNDDLRHSVTYTVTIKAVYPPADIKLTRIVDRSFFRAAAYHKIEWSYNTFNSDVVVLRYNLYRKLASEDESQFKLLASLEAGVYEYTDLKLPIDIRYSYRATTSAKCDNNISIEGCRRESAPSSIVENNVDID